MDVVASSGSPKVTKVRALKKQNAEDYQTAHDYYKNLRDAIVDLHKKRLDKTALSKVPDGVHRTKVAIYTVSVRGY